MKKMDLDGVLPKLTKMANISQEIGETADLIVVSTLYTVWQYGLWSFQKGYTKLERFSHKNQHTQRKLLNFENWTNGKPQ